MGASVSRRVGPARLRRWERKLGRWLLCGPCCGRGDDDDAGEERDSLFTVALEEETEKFLAESSRMLRQRVELQDVYCKSCTVLSPLPPSPSSHHHHQQVDACKGIREPEALRRLQEDAKRGYALLLEKARRNEPDQQLFETFCLQGLAWAAHMAHYTHCATAAGAVAGKHAALDALQVWLQAFYHMRLHYGQRPHRQPALPAFAHRVPPIRVDKQLTLLTAEQQRKLRQQKMDAAILAVLASPQAPQATPGQQLHQLESDSEDDADGGGEDDVNAPSLESRDASVSQAADADAHSNGTS